MRVAKRANKYVVFSDQNQVEAIFDTAKQASAYVQLMNQPAGKQYRKQAKRVGLAGMGGDAAP